MSDTGQLMLALSRLRESYYMTWRLRPEGFTAGNVRVADVVALVEHARRDLDAREMGGALVDLSQADLSTIIAALEDRSDMAKAALRDQMRMGNDVRAAEHSMAVASIRNLISRLKEHRRSE